MSLLTISAGDKPTAAQFNSFLTHTGSSWDAWVPVVSQSTTPTLTVNRAVYFRAGRLIVASATLSVASGTGTANNGVAVTLPVTAATYPSQSNIGAGSILDLSATAYYPCTAVWISSTLVGFLTTSTNTNVNAGQTGSAFAAALATGDVISFTITYEAATG